MQHERKGVKRPLPCTGSDATPTPSVSTARARGSPPPHSISRCVLSPPSVDSGIADTNGVPSLRHRPPPSHRRRNPEQGRQLRLYRSERCCRCQPRGGAIATLRLAGVVGIQVLGFLACPCRGFLPAGLGSGGGVALLADVQTRTTVGDFEPHASIHDVGDGSSSSSLGAMGPSFGGAGARGREGRRRTRGCRRSGGGFGGGDGDGGGGGGGGGTDGCGGISVSRATRLPSAEEGPPLGLLYDRALLKSGVAQGVDNTKSSSNKDSFRNGGGSANGGSNGSGGKVVLAVGTGGTSEDGGASAAATSITAAAAAATVVEIDRVESADLRVENNVAQNATAQWTSVVKGETAIARARGTGKQTAVAGAPPATEDGQRTAATAPRKKWSGKGWLVSRAEEENRQGPQQRRGGDSATVTDNDTNATSVDAAAAAADAAGAAVAAAGAAVASDPAADDLVPPNGRARELPGQDPTMQPAVGGDICSTAREELTTYLLGTGAPESLVATATAALFAAEPRCTLTEGTWKRWRQNLDGLRSTGFTGSDVSNMLALCPQLLALDFEGQVVPTMELLRKQLGMRPTDVRRVIRKAPEVLAPRADGSTAAETVDVLRALGLQTRHLRMEALRWPQLLAVPPGSFFQLAAFLASEEVGIKATNIGSLIRQAPWLVLQPIDGQMLPVARFLRIAGVMDVERVVRAYPKVLSASIKGELAPRVRFLWSDVGVSEEDLPRVLQTFPLLFALPLSRMQDVMDFLSEDLTINKKDIAKIIRAFPSLLGLERERHMDGVVRYLKQLGVQNVGRFVSRLPPVLGYDVDTNLVPKMDYLVSKMGLSVYDVLTFPAYFSYPLETVIEPRTEFLAIRGRPITLVGLNIALQQGDADFARKVAKVQLRVYREFKEAYVENRAAVRSGRRDAESLLSGPQRKAIGNLGGQSTSNNVSVTVRATGVPANRQPQPRKLPQQQQQQQRPQQRQQREQPKSEKRSQVD